MKAVIMAGGEGSRLRPLTCTLPKPLARLCGKPVLEYIFDLLIRHGVVRASVTLGYLAHMVAEQYPAGAYRQLGLDFVTEEQPLGTAGGVALAARHFSDSFLVISGDAMCDLDLSALRQTHEQTGAAVTILGMEVEDPREYGLMQVGADGSVAGFIEKPAWGQATTNLANTGIYMIRPDVLALVPEGRPFDFARDLFPLLMARGERIACHRASGYWCDIGDLDAYLRCQRDMLDHKVQCAMPRSLLPPGDYQLIAPCHIGDEAEISSGAVVGPYAVIDDGCFVGEHAKIRGSVLLKNVRVAENACLTGAIVCGGATVRRDAQLFEGSAVGEKAVVGAGAEIQPNVAVWPQKLVDPGTILRDNLKYGNQTPALFDDGGIGGAGGALLTPEGCAALGAAIGSVKSCKKAGVACDGTGMAKALTLALVSGLMSSGSHVWTFGDCFEAQLNFFTAFCGLGIGIFVNGGREPAIRLCGEGGLSVPRYLEREIEAKVRRAEYHRCTAEACKEIADMSSIRMMYCREMAKQAGSLDGMEARVRSANPQIQNLLEDTLARMGCDTARGPLLEISDAGTVLTIEENGQVYHPERLLAICCQQELRRGEDIALPYDAPEMLDALAEHEGRSALRYLLSPADQSDSAARRLSAKQPWVRDALFRSVKLLGIMKDTGKTLEALSAELPPFYVEKKSFDLPCPPSMLQKLLRQHAGGEARLDSAREGIILRRHNGHILITPGKNGRRVRLQAEAESMEIAQELCESAEELLLRVES